MRTLNRTPLLISLVVVTVVVGANAQTELRPVQVHFYGRGSLQEDYAITEGGQVVGVVRQRRSASHSDPRLVLGLGRRGGASLLLPSDPFWFQDWFSPVDPIEELWRRQMGRVSQALEEHLLLSLPWAPERQSLEARQSLLAHVLAANGAGTDNGSPQARMPMWVDARSPWLPGQHADAAELDWHMVDKQGGVNWGLLTFVALASACMAVWAGIGLQYLRYLRNKAQAGVVRSRAFPTGLVPKPSSPDVLMPLLMPESPSFGRYMR